MAAESEIGWTRSTFNPWMGCDRVSEGCKFCYAETLVTTRMRLNVWGPARSSSRRRTAASTWDQVRSWNRKAADPAQRPWRVFTASLADVFEDHPQLPPWRRELFELIESCPNLVWLLLTKRPQYIRDMVPPSWITAPLPNVWYGATVETQARAAERVPALLSMPAAHRFLSCEPLLEPVFLNRSWLGQGTEPIVGRCVSAEGSPLHSPDTECIHCGWGMPRIDWVIVGGESGPAARPFGENWALLMTRSCQAAGVPVFVKQVGDQPWRAVDQEDSLFPREFSWSPRSRGGTDPAEWPVELRVQEFPR